MRDLLQRKSVSAVLVIGALWLGLNVYRLGLQQGSESAQLKDVQARINDAQQENQILASSSDYFHSDAYLERQARLKLNYKMPGEQVAFVYPDSASNSEPVQANQRAMPNWEKWWYYVLGR